MGERTATEKGAPRTRLCGQSIPPSQAAGLQLPPARNPRCRRERIAATGWTEAIIAPRGAAGGCGWVGSLSAGSLGPPAGWALAQWQAVRGVGAGQEPGPEVPRGC